MDGWTLDQNQALINTPASLQLVSFYTLANLNPATREAQRGRSKTNLWIIQTLAGQNLPTSAKRQPQCQGTAGTSPVKAEFPCDLAAPVMWERLSSAHASFNLL